MESIDIDIDSSQKGDELSKYRNKDEREKSAVASHAVRQHLANFLLSRRPSQDRGESFLSSSGNIMADVQLEDEFFTRSKSSFQSSNDPPMRARDESGRSRPLARGLAVNTKDDHALRKTASLPTMLLSLKATSTSKRRQVERRTTMSPIMKRKTKQRRSQLEQGSFSSGEYSSNPCIDDSMRVVGARTPTPPALHKLSIGSSTTNLTGQRKSYQSSQSSKLTDSGHSSFNSDKMSHVRVTQALRLAVMQRATNKAKMTAQPAGGSFDLEGTIRVGANRIQDESTTMRKDELRQQSSLESCESRGYKLRPSFGSEWNHDVTKLRSLLLKDSTADQRPNAAPSHQVPSSQFCSSVQTKPISMSKPSSGSLIETRLSIMANRAHNRFCSSSSSISSLFSSQQDSFEDSGCHPIDLSSSTDPNRPSHWSQSHNNTSNQPHSTGGFVRSSNTNNGTVQSLNENQKLALGSCSLAKRLDQQSGENVLQYDRESTRHTTDRAHHHPNAGQFGASRDANSLDNPASVSSNLLASLANQLNISSSEQTLLGAGSEQAQQQDRLELNDMLAQYHGPPRHNQLANDQLPSSEQSFELFNRWLNVYSSFADPQTNEGSDMKQRSNNKNQQANSSDFNKRHPHERDSTTVNNTFSSVSRTRPNQRPSSRISQSHLNTSLLAREARYLCRLEMNQRNRSNVMARTLSSPILVSTEPVASTAAMRFAATPSVLMNSQFDLTPIDDGKTCELEEDSVIDMLIDDPTQTEQSEASTSDGACNLSLDLSNTNNNKSDWLDRAEGVNSAFSSLPNSSTRNEFSKLASMFTSPVELQLLRVHEQFEPQFDASSSTGITFDRRLCKHRCLCTRDENHLENEFRVTAIWRRLYDAGLLRCCARVSTREATLDEIKLIHGLVES